MRANGNASSALAKGSAKQSRKLLWALGSAFFLLISFATGAWADPLPDLGNRWEDSSPELWRGTWIRRGGQNIFDANWTHPQYGRAAAVVRVDYTATNQVRIERTDTIGPTTGRKCRYIAEISADGRTVYGSGSCDWAPGPIPLRAVIYGQTYRLFRNPIHPRRPDCRVDYKWMPPPSNVAAGEAPAKAFCRAMGMSGRVFGYAKVPSGPANMRTAYMSNNQTCAKGCLPFWYIQCRY